MAVSSVLQEMSVMRRVCFETHTQTWRFGSKRRGGHEKTNEKVTDADEDSVARSCCARRKIYNIQTNGSEGPDNISVVVDGRWFYHC
ncbi:hypothetical protein PFLUV_G00185970 [Perca fluviatilis]|uniref:Uncharacterized protein n=1 Tax=Perca fluviatilis TaxID=8168 RepID=A0A6A5EQE8_PERFL|nr:hypothetical protein PFLUV_G00185970 [Perca fluviatilis]